MIEGHPRQGACTVCQGPTVVRHADLRDRLFDAPGTRAMARCRNCGTFMLEPRPTEQELGQFYQSYFTHGEAADALDADPDVDALTAGALRSLGYRVEGTSLAAGLARVPAVRDLLQGRAYWLPSPPGRLLDVGCGDGRHLRLLRRLGWEVIGIDIDETAAEVARRRFGLDVRTCRMDELPAGSFDAVVLHHVFEHVADPGRVVSDIRRLLRPGGRCVVVTPNAASLGQRVFGRSWVHWDPPRHLQVFVPSSLATCLTQHGFDDVTVRTTARNARYAWSASAAIRLSRDERTDAGAPPAVHRIAGLLFQAVESIVLPLAPSLGEELVAVARLR